MRTLLAWFGLLLVGGCSAPSEMRIIQSAPYGGRYQLTQLGSMRRDQLLLDTVEGRIYRLTCMGMPKGADCSGEMAWTEERVIRAPGH